MFSNLELDASYISWYKQVNNQLFCACVSVCSCRKLRRILAQDWRYFPAFLVDVPSSGGCSFKWWPRRCLRSTAPPVATRPTPSSTWRCLWSLPKWVSEWGFIRVERRSNLWRKLRELRSSLGTLADLFLSFESAKYITRSSGFLVRTFEWSPARVWPRRFPRSPARRKQIRAWTRRHQSLLTGKKYLEQKLSYIFLGWLCNFFMTHYDHMNAWHHIDHKHKWQLCVWN